MKVESKDSIKEKIINSAMKIISNDGVDDVTTRKVAKGSGVNVAAINYYFGSKEKLIIEVIDFIFSKKVPGLFLILENPEYDTEEKLYFFFKSYMEELSKHPGIIKTIVTALLKGNMEFFNKILFIKKLITVIQELVAEHTGIKDINLVNIRVMHTMSAILFPIVMYKFYPKLFDNVRIFEDNNREIYIETLLKNTLNINVEKFSKKTGGNEA